MRHTGHVSPAMILSKARASGIPAERLDRPERSEALSEGEAARASNSSRDTWDGREYVSGRRPIVTKRLFRDPFWVSGGDNGLESPKKGEPADKGLENGKKDSEGKEIR